MKTFLELKKNLKKEINEVPPIKVAVIGDTATQRLCTALKGMGVERGLNIDLFEAEYNQVERQFLDPSSELFSFVPNYIILFQSTIKLLEKYSLSDAERQTTMSEDRINFLSAICQNEKLAKTRIICYNYPEIDDTVFGSFSNHVSSSFLYQLRLLNVGLMKLSQNYPNFYVCDLSSIQNQIGRKAFFSTNIYVTTEIAVSTEALPFVASRTIDIISSLEGKFKKCLILDLDNTLWGGVIGDDGMDGIQLGHGLGIGKAFTEFQEWIRKLKNRGIIICICSKNDEDKAKEPFEKHPEMVLRLNDIAVFMANWETKVDNIRTIQKILNIGFDSMVFIDDNPFERNIIRENIPGITVPELPEDPGLYLEYLYSENLFETTSFSSGDKDRTKQYQVEAKRVNLSKTFDNEDDFLESLNMVSEVSSFNSYNTPRVAQLSQRSNQFNLRTVRYTESDITEMAKDENVIDLSFTLEDKFGDNGLICVVILKRLGADTVFIDTWFMSCRVLKRGMENFVLNTMVDKAKQKGYKRIVGEFIPTAKNGMVENLLPSLGFSVMADNNKRNIYSLEIDEYKKKKNHIKLK